MGFGGADGLQTLRIYSKSMNYLSKMGGFYGVLDFSKPFFFFKANVFLALSHNE